MNFKVCSLAPMDMQQQMTLNAQKPKDSQRKTPRWQQPLSAKFADSFGILVRAPHCTPSSQYPYASTLITPCPCVKNCFEQDCHLTIFGFRIRCELRMAVLNHSGTVFLLGVSCPRVSFWKSIAPAKDSLAEKVAVIHGHPRHPWMTCSQRW